ncbi:tetratricopeptide repeat protein [Methylophaga sp.]|uniref:tetratricopeptide repeat protein n=1 Tax=Methylophaga sp. TaxID=2024840 RepID=UPI0013FF5796|nr:tetratricopeptide repeat protein [Methylophaga sp.]MTI63845.1 tetratricopeptide repeat protein [Methylophaga sp.]
MKKLFVMLALMISFSAAADVMNQVAEVQHNWAEANYQLKDKAQKTRFEALLNEADAVVKANPDSAEALIWRGIVQSSYAGIKGGLGALGLAKAARADFEQAMKIDDKALDGSAYTSLGTLYFKVPGWPLGFGDNDKAEALLKKALSINPEGIDSNYFYGVFLLDQRQYKQAEQYLLKAQQAPARPGRPLADKGRQQEIAAALQQVRYQLRTNQHAGIAD